MMDWRDLWNPVTILGGAGTVGLVAAPWPAARRGVAPGCLLALLLAGLSYSDVTNNDLARAIFTVSLIWGVLLTALHWNDSFGATEAVATASHDGYEMGLPVQLLLLSGLCLMAQAGDAVTLFMGLQVVSVGTTALASPRGKLALKSRFPLAWLLLLGFMLLVVVTGSTRLETIHEALQSSYMHGDAAKTTIAGGGSRVLMLSAVLTGSALAGYAVCAPLHFSMWSTCPGSDNVGVFGFETHPSQLLLPRAAALLAWVKLWPSTITAAESTAQLLVGVLAAVTAVVPLLQARIERRLFRQWWLLAVTQGSWLLLAIAAKSFEHSKSAIQLAGRVVEWNLPTAWQAAWLWLLMEGVALIGLCGVLAYLRRRERPVEFVEDLRGLVHCEPIAAVCACICLLSLSGLPLLAGFWSRLFVALAAMNVRGEWGPPAMFIPHSGLLLLTAFLALSAVWSASVAMRSVWMMLFEIPLGQHRPVGAISSLFAAVLASVIVIGCGILPGPLLSWLCAPRLQQQLSPEIQKAPASDDERNTQ